jgi:hypothetical protein
MNEDTDVHIKIARLEERLKSADVATKLAADSLEAWKVNANEWRQTFNDLRGSYITRAEMFAWLLVGLTALGLVLKYTR